MRATSDGAAAIAWMKPRGGLPMGIRSIACRRSDRCVQTRLDHPQNSKASCQQAAAARRARDAAVRALPIARVSERLEVRKHAAERAALCARAVEARAVVLEGEHLDAPRCERLRARGFIGLGLGSARTSASCSCAG